MKTTLDSLKSLRLKALSIVFLTASLSACIVAPPHQRYSAQVYAESPPPMALQVAPLPPPPIFYPAPPVYIQPAPIYVQPWVSPFVGFNFWWGRQWGGHHHHPR